MITRIEGLPDGVFGYHASGEVTLDDVSEIMAEFEAAEAAADGPRLFLAEYAADIEFGPDAFALSTDVWRSIERHVGRVAVIATKDLADRFEDMRTGSRTEARLFAPGRRRAAIDWLLAAGAT